MAILAAATREQTSKRGTRGSADQMLLFGAVYALFGVVGDVDRYHPSITRFDETW